MLKNCWKFAAVMLVELMCSLLMPGDVIAGLSEDEDAIYDPVSLQVTDLQFGFGDRSFEIVADAVEDMAADPQPSVSKSFKIINAAMAKIEKDAAKTARQIHKVVNKGVQVAERADGSKELFEELEELREIADAIETVALLEIGKLLWDAVGAEYGFDL